MSNDWTGGQYSLFRGFFGVYLFVHFAQLVPWAAEVFSRRGVLADASASPLLFFPNLLAWFDEPAVVTGLVVLAAALSLLFAGGLYDRVAAVLLWYILACLLGRNPLIANPGLPYLGWLLLAHAFLPPAPYGSWGARGRLDPGGGWRMPAGIFAAAWIVMAAGYSYSGYTKLLSPSWLDGTALARVLENPLARPGLIVTSVRALPGEVLQMATWAALALELLFAPLALIARCRPVLWGAMLLMHVSLIGLLDFADLSLAMVILHLFTFNPAWIGKCHGASHEMIFYDGQCGLCHRWVRFVIAEDQGKEAFQFAPLGGPAFQQAIGGSDPQGLPDSLVVRTTNGRLLTRSQAVLHILQRLGGAWRVLALVAHVLPAAVRDFFYDRLAHRRHRLFAPPAAACPMIPAEVRNRFQQ